MDIFAKSILFQSRDYVLKIPGQKDYQVLVVVKIQNAFQISVNLMNAKEISKMKNVLTIYIVMLVFLVRIQYVNYSWG